MTVAALNTQAVISRLQDCCFDLFPFTSLLYIRHVNGGQQENGEFETVHVVFMQIGLFELQR